MQLCSFLSAPAAAPRPPAPGLGLLTHLLREDAVERLHLLSCSGRLGLVIPIALVRQTEGCSQNPGH